jgi:hypothetical protein
MNSKDIKRTYETEFIYEEKSTLPSLFKNAHEQLFEIFKI